MIVFPKLIGLLYEDLGQFSKTLTTCAFLTLKSETKCVNKSVISEKHSLEGVDKITFDISHCPKSETTTTTTAVTTALLSTTTVTTTPLTTTTVTTTPLATTTVTTTNTTKTSTTTELIPSPLPSVVHPAARNQRKFDGWSFFGGAAFILAIAMAAFAGYKFYQRGKNQRNIQYRLHDDDL